MMNGVDLINNLIDELGRARDLLYSQNPEESSEEAVLVNDIRTIDIMIWQMRLMMQ